MPTVRGAAWMAIALVACAHHARPRPSPLAPSRAHATAPRIATFAPAAVREERPIEIAAATTARPIAKLARSGGRSIDTALLRAIRAREPSLHRCWVAALRADPGLGSIKVPLHLRVGARGAVVDATASGGPRRLDACIGAVARRLSLPAPGAPTEVEVPLLFSPRS